MQTLIDTAGRATVDTADLFEPNPASIVLVDGEFGTAWQRHFSDGLWHSSRGGKAKTWDEILTHRNVVLAYDAPTRRNTSNRKRG